MLLNSNPVTAVTYMGMSENAVSLIWSGSGLTAGGAAQIWAYSPNGIVMLDARL